MRFQSPGGGEGGGRRLTNQEKHAVKTAADATMMITERGYETLSERTNSLFSAS
jgi:hypothetical protein